MDKYPGPPSVTQLQNCLSPYNDSLSIFIDIGDNTLVVHFPIFVVPSNINLVLEWGMFYYCCFSKLQKVTDLKQYLTNNDVETINQYLTYLL